MAILLLEFSPAFRKRFSDLPMERFLLLVCGLDAEMPDELL